MKEIIIREYLKPGDLGYLVHMHAVIYKAECNYDLEFEGYVCKTFYEFVNRYSEDGDKFFIAEHEGKIIGSIAILGHSKSEAQLRWFLIEPQHRGSGLGKELLKRAMKFCEEKSYKNIWLLTTSDQEKAAAMYEKVGFKLIEEVPQTIWGRTLNERKYELRLP